MFEEYNDVQRAVLQTTLHLISKRELQATSMALIAKESGVSTGNIYHYFQSKEDIVNELYKAIVDFNGRFVLAGLSREGTVRERFFRVWEKVVELSREHPESFQFFEQYSFSPYIHDSAKREAYSCGWCGPMSELYAEAVERQLFVELKPTAAAWVQMHYGSLVYLVKAHMHGHYELTADVIGLAIESCWNAVARERSDAG